MQPVADETDAFRDATIVVQVRTYGKRVDAERAVGSAQAALEARFGEGRVFVVGWSTGVSNA